MTQPQPRNRAYRTFNYLPVDRVADEEFGFWPQTLRAWVPDGFPKDLADEIGENCFHHKFNELIGIDTSEGGAGVPLHVAMSPPFDHEVLEEAEQWQIVRDGSGVVAKRWKGGRQESSIPQFLEFPVTDRASWEAMKRRFRLDDPSRKVSDEAIGKARQAAADGWAVSGFACGFYGALRNWVGTENLSYLLYDDPAVCHDMAEHWAALILASLRQVPDDVPIHQFGWWEDMAYRSGPLVSPATFDEFFVPCYQAVMDELRRHGCTIAWVDCDGNIHDLVPGWLRTGVNVMFPCEVAAGTDMARLRDTFGLDVRLRGGIDKIALARGRDAIDRELDRVAPFLDQGGFIPHLDHLVPPDIPFDDYMYYREQKKKLIGKQ